MVKIFLYKIKTEFTKNKRTTIFFFLKKYIGDCLLASLSGHQSVFEMVGGTWKREQWPGTQCFILFLAWDSLLSPVKVKSISSGLSFPINWAGYECWHFNVRWFTGESSSSQAGRSPQPGSQTSEWRWLWFLCHCRLCELDSLTPDSHREGGAQWCVKQWCVCKQ